MAYTVTITGASQYVYIQIGSQVFQSATSLSVDEGTNIICNSAYSAITVDGVEVGDSYTLTVKSDVTISIVNDRLQITTKSAGSDTTGKTDIHNTNIGNVACEIESGTVLIGGVVREIEIGRTLVNGGSREIAFGADVVSVAIILNNPYRDTNCYIEIGGTKCTSEVTVDVEIGTEVICYITTTSQYYTAYVDYNGERKLKSTTANKWVSYAFTIESSLNILMGGHSGAGQIKITTL